MQSRARLLIVVVGLAVAGVALRLTVLRPEVVQVEVARVEAGVVEESVTNSRAGTVKARRYHTTGWNDGSPIPLFWLSKQNGT